MSDTPRTDKLAADLPAGDSLGAIIMALRLARELERALEESVKLQSHYATLLNMHDGGQRMTFTVDTWLARLNEPATRKP